MTRTRSEDTHCYVDEAFDKGDLGTAGCDVGQWQERSYGRDRGEDTQHCIDMTLERDSHTNSSMVFTDDEIKRFSKRLDEGYDIPDPRYELWKLTHVQQLCQQSQVQHYSHTTAMSKILNDVQPKIKMKEFHPKTTARVLTSQENLQAINEKEEKKKKEQLQKENRKIEREKKKLEKFKEQKAKDAGKTRNCVDKTSDVTETRFSKDIVDKNQVTESSCDGIAVSIIDEISSTCPVELFCYCRQPESGNMIACDFPNCSIEWYHLSCLNLKSVPKGKWYCHECKKLFKGRHPSKTLLEALQS